MSRSHHKATRRWLLTGGFALCGAPVAGGGLCLAPLDVQPKRSKPGDELANCYACIKGCRKLSVRPAEMVEEPRDVDGGHDRGGATSCDWHSADLEGVLGEGGVRK